MSTLKLEYSKPRKKNGLIFVISGPSGSGKTTLVNRLLKDKDLKHKLVKSISFTTRPRRLGERNGRDYFFISAREFRKQRRQEKILEWTKYLGYYYGTPKNFIEKQLRKPRRILLCLDLKGAFKIKRIHPENTVTIFVNPPSLETLNKRILKRCNKTKKDEIQKRLRLAKRELLASSRYDYCILNKKLPQAIKELKEIILREIVS